MIQTRCKHYRLILLATIEINKDLRIDELTLLFGKDMLKDKTNP